MEKKQIKTAPYRILLVDDNREFLKELEYCLEEYEVLMAHDGRQALEILVRPEELDLVLMDVKMPGLDGISVMEIIKKDHANLPVIIMTAFVSEDMLVKSLRKKADDFLIKPIEIPELLQRVEFHLRKRPRRQSLDVMDTAEKVERVKEFIEKHCFSMVSLKDAAELVCLSPKYLGRIFKKETGMNFTDYRVLVKVSVAKKLLKETSANVTQIGWKLGFKNPESFMRMFKIQTGMTPTEYREKNG